MIILEREEARPMTAKNMQVLLNSRPSGWVQEGDFRIVETEIPAPGDGQVLVRSLFLSLDPYMRGRMNDAKSYATPVPIGGVMEGETVSEVVQSNNARFKAGDIVVCRTGWQQYAVSDGTGMRKVDPKAVPLTTYLGVVGMPGVTAWIDLLDIGQPKEGETVVVAAATGAVGGVVGQIAKLKGCRAVGIAGGKAKCDYAVKELGFDACVDYRDGHLYDALAAATPKGIDVYFENVGGEILDTVLRRLNANARIPLCGLISQYNATDPYGVKNLASLLVNRVKLEGFIVSDRMQRWPVALPELAGWVASGKIKYRETITEGLEKAPKAFIGLLKGENFGKQLVKTA